MSNEAGPSGSPSGNPPGGPPGGPSGGSAAGPSSAPSRRTPLTLRERVRLLFRMMDGIPVRQLVRETGIPRSTLQGISNNRIRTLSFANSGIGRQQMLAEATEEEIREEIKADLIKFVRLVSEVGIAPTTEMIRQFFIYYGSVIGLDLESPYPSWVHEALDQNSIQCSVELMNKSDYAFLITNFLEAEDYSERCNSYALNMACRLIKLSLQRVLFNNMPQELRFHILQVMDQVDSLLLQSGSIDENDYQVMFLPDFPPF